MPRWPATLGEQLGLSEAVLEALGAAYEQWDGRGWPGRLRGTEVPIAARLAQIGEFVEVAYRVGGVRRGQGARPRRAAASSSTRSSRG